MKKVIAVLLAACLLFVAACGNGGNGADAADEVMYISILSKGFQHQFWQTVYAGAQTAAASYGVEIFFDGPESEADIHVQVDMFNAELAKNPTAIAIAALDTESVFMQLQEAYDRGIPVVAFDSGVPGAPPGQVLATASTDNHAAGGLAAINMMPAIQSRVAAGTPDNPAIIIVLSQDAVGESLVSRANGFVEEMYSLANNANDGGVFVTGDMPWLVAGTPGGAVEIRVIVGASPGTVDMTHAAHGALATTGLVGVFMSNEASVNGMIAAYVAGASIPDGVILVGFDAGAPQKEFVREGIFYGSVTQDPYRIGYLSVSLAVRAARGETVRDVDTGARWWNADNMDDPEIAPLLYD